jgi:hypothetical protein
MEQLRKRPQPQKPKENEPLPRAVSSGGALYPDPEPSGVQVIWGASVQTLQLGGMQVQHARRLLQSLMHIDPAAPALINGEPARPNQRINEGDTLEFVVHAGEKGYGH